MGGLVPASRPIGDGDDVTTADLALRLIVAALATWRVTSLLVNEAGPWEMFARLRGAAGVGLSQDLLPSILQCFWCCSVWVGIVITVIAILPIWWVLVPLALSAVAVVIEERTGA
jgi:hypothetical protein